MNENYNLDGRVVVVTGGLGQLGRGYVRSLVQSGARVAVLDLSVDPELVASRLGDLANNPAVLCVAADIGRRESVRSARLAVEARWGPVFGLVNNAALDTPPDAPASENGPFETYPESSLDRVLAVNVKGTVICCQEFGGAMAQAGRGSIVNIGSIYGVVSPDQRIYEYRRSGAESFFKPVAYGLSKAAVRNLTRYLATYWAGRGVRVNTLILAGVFNHQDPRFLTGYCAKVPLGRMAHAGEYDGAVCFLMSDSASYMTGSEMTLDGGFTAW